MPSRILRRTALPRWGLQLSERRVLLLVGDVLAASAAMLLALWLWTFTSGAIFSFAYLRSPSGGAQSPRLWTYALIPAWILLNVGLYDLRAAASRRATARGLLAAAGMAAGLYLGAFFFAPRDSLPRLVVLYFIGGAFSFSLLWRLVYIGVFVSGSFQRRALLVGAGWAGETLLAALAALPPGQYAIAGLIDDDPEKQGRTVMGLPVLGGHECLLAAVQKHQVSEIILAISGEVQGGMFRALLDCQAQGLDVVRMPLLYEQLTGQVPVQHLDADWIITSFVDAVQLNNLSRAFRRLLDLTGALVGLLVLALIFPWVVAAIWLESGGPIFYRQVRTGRGGRRFEILKFRTMKPEAEIDGQPHWAARQDARVTRVGWFLRRMRLDEAPQFWNVLKGEMGLVGPRPERPEFIARLEQQIPFYRARLLVKPGITGWAQVNYSYAASVEDAAIKLQYDLYYIKNRSIWLDVLILARTVGVVFGLKGT